MDYSRRIEIQEFVKRVRKFPGRLVPDVISRQVGTFTMTLTVTKVVLGSVTRRFLLSFFLVFFPIFRLFVTVASVCVDTGCRRTRARCSALTQKRVEIE